MSNSLTVFSAIFFQFLGYRYGHESLAYGTFTHWNDHLFGLYSSFKAHTIAIKHRDLVVFESSELMASPPIQNLDNEKRN